MNILSDRKVFFIKRNADWRAAAPRLLRVSKTRATQRERYLFLLQPVWLQIAHISDESFLRGRRISRVFTYFVYIMIVSYRDDFPIFSHNPGLVYLDSGATTQKPQVVIDAVSHYLSHDYSNIHRWSYDLAQRSEDFYDEAKEAFARLISANVHDCFFSFSTTILANMIVHSLSRSWFFCAGDEVICMDWDHHATIVPLQMWAKDCGFILRFCPIDADGLIDYEALAQMISPRTKLVVYSHVTNVLGTIADGERIRWLCHEDCMIMVDASQSLAHMQVRTDFCDILISTAHKIYANTWLGMAWMRASLRDRLYPWFWWWGIVKDVNHDLTVMLPWVQAREPGTPNLVWAVSLLASLKYIDSIGGIASLVNHEKQLIAYFLEAYEKFCSVYPDILHLYAHTQPDRQIGVFSFGIRHGRWPKTVGDMLGMHNVCVRAWWHCAHILVHALGEQYGTLRVSFGVYTTVDDIDRFFTVLWSFDW